MINAVAVAHSGHPHSLVPCTIQEDRLHHDMANLNGHGNGRKEKNDGKRKMKMRNGVQKCNELAGILFEFVNATDSNYISP